MAKKRLRQEGPSDANEDEDFVEESDKKKIKKRCYRKSLSCSWTLVSVFGVASF